MKRILILILALSIISEGLPIGGLAASDYNILPTHYMIEAENSTITGEFYEITEDAEASSGKALYCNRGFNASNGESSSEALLEAFNIPVRGFYFIWIRAKISYTNNESFFYSLNGAADTYYEIGNDKTYQWYNLGRHIFNGGENTFCLKSREIGVSIDKVYFTTSSTYVPTGAGEIPPSVFDESYVNEFEDTQYPLPDEHPRVFIRQNDIPDVINNLKHEENRQFYDELISQSAETIDCTLASSIPSGALDNANSEYLNYITLNALNYLLYNNETSADNAVNGIVNYLNSLLYEGSTLGSYSGVQSTAIFAASLVYDWCYDAIPDDTKKLIIELCISHASTTEMMWPATFEKAYAMGHSCEQGIIRDFFAFSIAVYDEYPDAYNHISDRVFNEFVPTFNYLYENGSMPNQGNFYGVLLRFSHELYLKWLLKTIGYGELLSDKQEETAYQLIYARKPDGVFLKDADDNSARTYYYPATHSAFLAGNLYDNPYLRQEVYRSARYGTNTDLRFNDFMALFLILNDPEAGLETFEALPLSRWTGKLNGTMIARTSWEEGRNSSGMVVSMKVPEKFFKSHQHLDSGEFEIYYKGALALDSGVYSYFGNDHDYGYHKQTIAHNCMLLYDSENDSNFYKPAFSSMGGQYPSYNTEKPIETLEEFTGENTDFGEVLGYDYGMDLNKPEYTYLKGDLTKAYNGKADNYTRTFMFNNLFDDIQPGVLIVLDKVTSSNENLEKTWLLHSQEEPEISGSRTIIDRTTNGYGGRLVVDTLLPEGDMLSVGKVGGSGSEFLVGDTNFSAVGDSESGQWRLEIKSSSAAETDYFLNVMQVSDCDDSITPLECEKLELEDYFGVKIKDRIIYLSKNTERNSNPLSINISGDGEYIVQVDGLSAGSWQVTNSNGLCEAVNVPENSGVAAFRLPAGDYTLSRINEAFIDKNYSIEANTAAAENDLIPVKRDSFMDTSWRVYNIDGNAYVEISEFAEAMDATVTYGEDSATFSKTYEGTASTTWYITYYKDSYKINKYCLYPSNQGRKYLPVPTVAKDDKLYIPVLSTAKVIQSALFYNPEYNMLAVETYTPPNSNPPDNTLSSLTFQANLTSNEGGVVSGDTLVTADETSVYTITADEGYYIDSVSFNGAAVCEGALEEFVYTTPEIKGDFTIDAVFKEIASMEAESNPYPEFYQTSDEIVVFIRINNLADYELSEYGIIGCDTEIVTEASICNEYRSNSVLRDDGMFGIRLINPFKIYGDCIYIRGYVDYKKDNETVRYVSDNVLKIQGGLNE